MVLVSDSRSNLLWRTLSAVVLGPVVLAAVWYGTPAYEGLILIGWVAAAVEWRALSGRGNAVTEILFFAAIPMTILLAMFFQPEMVLGAIAAVAAIVFIVAPGPAGARLWPSGGVLYLCLPALALVYLRGLPGAGREVVLLLFLVIWATDIMAFAIGRAVGGPRLAPRVSPGKTWSGLAGGVVAAAAAALGAVWIWSGAVKLEMALAGAVLAIVSQIGDLMESAVKRHFGRKDAGSMIPGHGGVLDRIDGLLAAAPAMALFVWLTDGGGS